MSATAKQIQQPASTQTPQLETSTHPFRTFYSGTAKQLTDAGVLPAGYTFPKRGKEEKFLAVNGFEYTVSEVWVPRGTYEVFVSVPDSVLFTAQVQSVIEGVHRLFLSLPGRPLQLVNVMADGPKIENLRFVIVGPRVSRGTVCYSLAAVMELYAQEEILASGTLKSPAGYLHTLPSPVEAPAARPAPRRTIARTLAVA